MLTLATLTRVPGEVDTVNMTVRRDPDAGPEARPYHHGRLREALVDAALDLARTGGPDAVVLRAAARVTGVSHNAAYRHFADRDELLRAVGERCTSKLALRMEEGITAVVETHATPAAWARLDAIGRAYVGFAESEPGWFRTAFAAPRDPATLEPGEGGGRDGRRPYDLLSACLDDLVTVGAVPGERRPGLEFATWSAVHGLSTLFLDGPLRDLPDAEREQVLTVVLAVVARGL